MDPIEVEFSLDRKTANTVRFSEITEEDKVPMMGTVYLNNALIRKFGIDPANAKKCKLRVVEVTE